MLPMKTTKKAAQNINDIVELIRVKNPKARI
jgi:hypothetical protein